MQGREVAGHVGQQSQVFMTSLYLRQTYNVQLQRHIGSFA